MAKHVALMKYTEKGLANIQQSPERAEAITAAARKQGLKVETVLWTSGQYDGLLIVDAPDDETVASFMLSIAKMGNVSTCTMRAYDAGEFRKILSKLG